MAFNNIECCFSGLNLLSDIGIADLQIAIVVFFSQFEILVQFIKHIVFDPFGKVDVFDDVLCPFDSNDVSSHTVMEFANIR